MKDRTLAMCDDFFDRHPDVIPLKEDILHTAELIITAYRNGGKLLLCGNGGSCADCDHIVGELMKGFLLKRPLEESLQQKLKETFGSEGEVLGKKLQRALPAISLAAHPALLTAFANDVDTDLFFAQQVIGYGGKNDVLIGISTSGNAKNVSAAVMTAKALGITTLGLTGKGGGLLKKFADFCIIAPAQDTYRIQEYHLVIYHFLCAYVEAEMFDR